jgi:TPR repeat protein
VDLAAAEALLDGADPQAGAVALRALADAGEPRAMLQLANRLWAGRGFAADPTEGEAWLRRAADDGYPRAMLSLGQRLLYGMGLDADRPTGLAWIRRAAEAGFAPAMTSLGELTGELAWLERAAEAGHAPAMTRLGEATGDARWLERAAAAGHGRAMGLLGEALLPDPRAYELLAAALQRGEAGFGLKLGLAHYQAGALAEAVQVFRRCLAMGAQGAAANLAYMARRGDWPPGEPLPDLAALLAPLVARRDPAGLVNWALCLAPTDPAAARALLAGVPDDALGWWRELAAQGDAEGLWVVGG